MLAWFGAGRPAVDDCEGGRPGRCYWCGTSLDGLRATGKDWLPDSFPAHDAASAKASPWLCEPCCWSMGQRNALPVAYSAERIVRKAEAGRRSDVVIAGESASRKVLILRLDDGRIGLWATGKNASQEEAWTKRVAELRTTQVDIGPCRFLGAWPLADLSPAPTERMQSYHHFATISRWRPCTDTDRAAIRTWLLDPPDEAWTGAISDGKKHGLPFTRVSPARSVGMQLVYFLGDIIVYRPRTLAALLDAVETMVRAGAGDEEIETGRYHTDGIDFVLARTSCEPWIVPHRGGALLRLAMYLRRNRKELTTHG